MHEPPVVVVVRVGVVVVFVVVVVRVGAGAAWVVVVGGGEECVVIGGGEEECVVVVGGETVLATLGGVAGTVAVAWRTVLWARWRARRARGAAVVVATVAGGGAATERVELDDEEAPQPAASTDTAATIPSLTFRFKVTSLLGRSLEDIASQADRGRGHTSRWLGSPLRQRPDLQRLATARSTGHLGDVLFVAGNAEYAVHDDDYMESVVRRSD